MAHDFVVLVELFLRVVAVAVLKERRFEQEARLEFVLVGGVPEGDPEERDHIVGKIEETVRLLDAVADPADEASAEPEALEGRHGALGGNARAHRGGEKVLGPAGVGVRAEGLVPVHVGAEDPEFRGGLDVLLVARKAGEGLPQFGVGHADDRDELQEARGGGRADRFGDGEAVLFGDGLVGEVAHGGVGAHEVDDVVSVAGHGLCVRFLSLKECRVGPAADCFEKGVPARERGKG